MLRLRDGAIAMLASALLFSGCGGADLHPAAEPAESPPLTATPAGTVRAVGAGAEGMIFHRRSGTVAVGLREPYRLAFIDLT